MKNNEEVIKDFGSWNVPTSWSDITLKKYEEIERYYEGKDEKFDVRDVLNILTDKTEDEINALPAEFLDTILTHLIFLTLTPEVGEPTNKIVIDGETYRINIENKLKVGEYVAVDAAIKGDKHNYAAILAILCRKEEEKYDSYFENEVLEERIKLFEKQPVINILPLINFFIKCFIISQMPSQLSLKIEEAISHTRSSIENSHKNGEISKRCMKSAIRKLQKLEKSIKCI